MRLCCAHGWSANRPVLQRCEGILHVSPDFAVSSPSVLPLLVLAFPCSALLPLPRVMLYLSARTLLILLSASLCHVLHCYFIHNRRHWQSGKPSSKFVVLKRGASSLAVLHHHMAPSRPHCLSSGCFWGLAQLLTQSNACCCL